MERQTIRELTEATKANAIQAGYRKNGIINFSYTWNVLNDYANQKGVTHFSNDFGVEFLRDHYGITTYIGLTGHDSARVRAIQLLNDVQNSGYVISRRVKSGYVYPAIFQSVIAGYIDSRKSAGIVPASIQVTKLYLERFANYLTAQRIAALSEVDMPVIEGFARSLAVYGKPTINHTLRIVRGLLKFAYDTGTITVDRSNLVPHVHYNRRARVPSAYTSEEISRLLATVDRNNPVGKRDYAILLLASRLGLRASDICGLTFENIKWEENRIELIQQKTGNMLTLPLTEEVGMALIDYLKNGRPITDCPCVLVRHVQPYDAVKPSSTYTIVSRYFEKSGIPMPPGKKRGPHALRHSLASALLENNIPLPVISEVLGHTDTNTTGVYLKIDIENLRKCAIAVPFYAENGKAGVRYDED
jgi:site-specific recombinase XerD